MARDKYVVLSDGRRLKVCERADGSEYYNDGGEHKTLRSNQRTSFDGTGNTRSGANETPRKGPVAPANSATSRVEYVLLSDGRRLRLYNRSDGSKFYINDGELRTLRSNQRVESESSGEDSTGRPRSPAPPRPTQLQAAGRLRYTKLGNKVPRGKPARCPYTDNGRHPVCKSYSIAGRLLRSTAAKRAFLEDAGYPYGQPAGTHVDHVFPLCLGGADCPCNMQLLTEEDHKVKTRKDLADCRAQQVPL